MQNVSSVLLAEAAFEFVPSETILNIALFVPLRNIIAFCQTSKKFNDIICDNEYFWRQKFIQDYKFVPTYYTGSWKHLYQNYRNVWVCGDNYFGQLGLGDNKYRNIPVKVVGLKVKQVSSSEYHTVLIDINNNVWTFGNNKFGQLGIGDFENKNTPTQIPNMKARKVIAGKASVGLITI